LNFQSLVLERLELKIRAGNRAQSAAHLGVVSQAQFDRGSSRDRQHFLFRIICWNGPNPRAALCGTGGRDQYSG
jgi:hypothetical protein